MISKVTLSGWSIALLSLSAIAQTTKILPGTGVLPLSQTRIYKSMTYAGVKKNNLTLPDYERKKAVMQRLSMNTNPIRQHNELTVKDEENYFFLNNRRNRYSTLWAFASLNYLYADLVGLMDKNILKQYQNGVVDGTQITPGFLSVAAGLMQIPLVNVFLPQVIKNEQTLKWVQIASGIAMSLVQSGTLFMGKPAPYYILFSAIEIGTTAYITIDAIKWKTKRKNPAVN